MFLADIYLLDRDKWLYGVAIYAPTWSEAWQAAEAIALCHAPEVRTVRLIYAFREVPK